MQQVELSSSAVATLSLENGLVSVHLHQIRLEVCADLLLLNHLLQSLRILGNAKHNSLSHVERNVGSISNTSLAQSFLSQIHDLLGSSSTLDGHRRLSEDGFASLELIDEGTELFSVLASVDGADHAVRVVKSLSCTLDLVPVELVARSDDQLVVSPLLTVLSHQLVLLGKHLRDSKLFDGDILMEERSGNFLGVFTLVDSSSDHGPGGLVTVDTRGLEHSHMRLDEVFASDQVRNKVETSRTSSNNANGSMLGRKSESRHESEHLSR